MFLINITIPQNIKIKYNDFDNIYLYNIDDLKKINHTNTKLHQTKVTKTKSILQNKIHKLTTQLRKQSTTPMIQTLQKHIINITNTKTTKTLKHLKKLDNNKITTIQKLTQIVTTQLTQKSINTLKQTTNNPNIKKLTNIIHQIFELKSNELK